MSYLRIARVCRIVFRWRVWHCVGFGPAGLWRFRADRGRGALAGMPLCVRHGCLVGSDVAAAVGGVAAVYCFWRWLKSPKWSEAMIAGAVLGLAELCKFTLLVFYPILPVLWIAYRLPERKTMDRRDWLRQGGMLSGNRTDERLRHQLRLPV